MYISIDGIFIHHEEPFCFKSIQFYHLKMRHFNHTHKRKLEYSGIHRPIILICIFFAMWHLSKPQKIHFPNIFKAFTHWKIFDSIHQNVFKAHPLYTHPHRILTQSHTHMHIQLCNFYFTS